MAESTQSHPGNTYSQRRRSWWPFRIEAEKWSEQQVQFSEDSLLAARRALWFLKLVEVDSEAGLREHAQRQAHKQLDKVKPPEPKDWCNPGDPKEKCDYSGAIEPKFTALVETWEQLTRSLSATNGSVGSVDELKKVEAAIVGYIKRGRPLEFLLKVTYSIVPALRQFVLQHVVFLITLALSFGVFWKVEAVNSILMNAPRFTVAVFVAAITPLILLRGAEYLVNTGRPKWLLKRPRVAPWNLGGRIVHSVRTLPAEPQPWVKRHPDRYPALIYWSLALKVLLHVLLWIGLGLLLQASIPVVRLDEMVLTVYLIVALCALVVLLGGAVDFADMHSPSPLRWMMLVGAVLVGISIILFDDALRISVVLGFWVAIMGGWSYAIKNGRTIWVSLAVAAAAVVAISMTNARQRGEVWPMQGTAAVRVDPIPQSDWPRGDTSTGPVVVLAASGGGSRAAIFTARTLQAIDSEMPDVRRNLQAISSVSGGSLASAVYISRRLRDARIVTDTSGNCKQSVTEAVSRDFIQPTIAGLWRKGGRGKGIERDWEKCPVGLAGISINQLAAAWKASSTQKAVPFPVPLFNSVSLERNAVVISPFQQEFFKSSFDDEARGDSNKYILAQQGDAGRRSVPTWVYYRSGIYHLQDISGGINAPLSHAVRASANFPFGFPLVEVEVDTSKRLHYSTSLADAALRAARKTVLLTDGGALSNSGMWPLVPLLVNQRQQIGEKRGVLMIVVDASRMPEAGSTDRQRGLLGTILDKSPKGERLHFQMLEQLQATFGGCFGYIHIGIEPSSDLNVYTTWALDKESARLVNSAFDAAWKDVGPQLKKEFEELKNCDKKDVRRPLRIGRVPLS